MPLVTPIPWTHVMFVFEDHIGMTRDANFVDNLLFKLLEFRPSR